MFYRKTSAKDLNDFAWFFIGVMAAGAILAEGWGGSPWGLFFGNGVLLVYVLLMAARRKKLDLKEKKETKPLSLKVGTKW